MSELTEYQRASIMEREQMLKQARMVESLIKEGIGNLYENIGLLALLVKEIKHSTKIGVPDDLLI